MALTLWDRSHHPLSPLARTHKEPFALAVPVLPMPVAADYIVDKIENAILFAGAVGKAENAEECSRRRARKEAR